LVLITASKTCCGVWSKVNVVVKDCSFMTLLFDSVCSLETKVLTTSYLETVQNRLCDGAIWTE